MILDKDKSKLISRDILLSTYKELLDNSDLKKKLKKLYWKANFPLYLL
jgi:hypothetical protein